VTETISRKQFLRGDFKNRYAPIRPPWSGNETDFLDSCSQCGECIKVCPEKILISGSGHYPEVSFANGECTFCFKCADSCHDNALSGQISDLPWQLEASINELCLTFKGIHCMSCRDQCETEAITFIPKLSQPAQPVIKPLLCNGCGACFKPCPAKAIKLSVNKSSQSINMSSYKESAI